MKTKPFDCLIVAFVLGFGCSLALAQTVRITPLGSHDGEFCRNDRAMIFEDPNGLRILYDPGRTVTGGTDARLLNIDVMLLSHVHVDHLGDVATSAVNQGSCGSPDTSVDKTPNSNFAEIAAKKEATVYVGGEMAAFLDAKIDAAAGKNTNQTAVLRPGGKRIKNEVTFATVRALHSNGVSSVFLNSPLPEGLTAYVGPEEGYIIGFTNGLVAYLSGDTGVTSDMETVVRNQYGAKLAVINIGDIFSTGPEEAAYAINKLIKPKSVIPSHANEAATDHGVVLPNTRTETFINLVNGADVYVPLSGITMEFDGSGKCVAGC